MAELPNILTIPENLPPTQQVNILLVDDQPANLLALEAILQDLGHNLVQARSGEEALQRLLVGEFAVVLLEVRIPGISGFDTARLIRANDRTRHTPIIFLTANDIDRPQLEEAYALGAVDLLVKPLLPVVLHAKIRGFVELFQDKQRARREAEQLRLLVQGIADYAIFMLDPKGNILTWNSGAERLKGYKANEIIGQHSSRFYPRDAIEREWPKYELEVARTEGRFEDEGWRVRKDGSRFWANVVITALHDEAGSLRGFSKITRDMTERRRAEENARRLVEEAAARRVAEDTARLLQEQRERLHVTLASIGDAVISTDDEGRINFLNPVAEELVGWKTAEATGRKLEDVFHIVNEETRLPVENPALRALRDGKIVGLANHTILISKEGTERPIDDSAAPTRDAEGNIVGCVLVFRDVSEQRRAQQASRKNQEILQLVHKIGKIGHWEWNSLTDENKWSPEIEALYGLPPGGFEGSYQGWAKLLHPDDLPKAEQDVRGALESGEYFSEFRVIWPDGSVHWLETRAQVFKDNQDRPVRIVGVNMDITERKRVEEERRHSEQRTRSVLESISDAFFAVDRDWRFSYVNPQAERLLDRKPGDLLGQVIWDVYPGLIESEFEKAYRRVATERISLSHTSYYPDHNRWYEVHVCPAPDGGISIYFQDVSERKRADAEVDRLREASEQQRRIYETALSNSADFNYVFDLRGRFVYVNKALLALWGKGLNEAIGKDFLELDYPPDLAERLQRQIQFVIDSRQPLTDETPYSSGVGERQYEYIFVPVLGAGGEVEAVAGSTRDITERKRAEEALREVEARFTAILNYSPSCIFAKDRQGRYLLANKALGEFTGRDVADLLGRTDADIFPAEVAARFARDDGNLLASGCPRIYEESFPHADTTVTALTVKFPLVGADGTPYAVCGIATDISDRKRAQDALRESEGRWRSLAEALPNLVWTDLPDGQCDYLSSQWASYTGIPVEKLLGLNWLDIVIHPDDRERTAALWKAACEDKADYDLEYRIRRHDGQYHWFKTRGVPIRDELGRIVKWFGTCTDIEDQKQANEALAQSEERFRQLADAMPQIVWTTRPDGNIDYLNRKWYEFTGLPETLGNEGWAQILHAADAPTAKERWAASVRSGAPFEMEIRLLDRRRQTYRWHLIRTVAVQNGAGRVARWFGTSTDIHDQKRAEESSRYLAEASATLAGVVDYESTLQKVANLAVPYFADWSAVDVANDDGSLRRLAVAHQDAEKIRLAHELMLQYPPDPQAAGGALAVLRTGKPEIVAEITNEMLVQGAKDERHLRLVHSLGLKSYICVPLVVSGNPLGVLTFATAESGRTYTDADLALAKDLAHRAGVAIENTQLYQALRETDRRKDEFLATLAHELRNPLAPIRNSLQILKMPRLDAATIERSRDMMERQVHQLVRLVDDLLDVSRVMRGKIELRKERVELSSVIAHAVETVQPLIEAQGHELTVQLPPESLSLDADPVRLAQVVGNLLTNAAKYTEPNGRIRLTAQREDGEAVLRVRDSGIGIAPDMLPHIFELFVQVDHAATRSQGGLGIGLTLVKNLMEMHGGSVAARSAGLGKGSEFTVRLPLMASPTQQSDDKDRTVADQTPSQSGHRVLVVDDNHDAAISLSMLLRLQGHEVRVAHDGASGLELAATFQPSVIFLDIGMPGMDGYEVARRVRKTPGLEKTVLAALTGWGQQEDRRRTAEAGFDHHLVKPPEPQAVEAVLATLPK